MQNEYLTVKQFAELVCRNRQTIYNKLDTDLQPYAKQINGVQHIHIDAQNLFTAKNRQSNRQSNRQPKTAELGNLLDNPYIQDLRAEIEFLKSELKTVHQELQNQQSLLAREQDKVKQLEEKVNNEPQNEADVVIADVVEENTQTSTEDSKASVEPKTSFWEKLKTFF